MLPTCTELSRFAPPQLYAEASVIDRRRNGNGARTPSPALRRWLIGPPAASRLYVGVGFGSTSARLAPECSPSPGVGTYDEPPPPTIRGSTFASKAYQSGNDDAKRQLPWEKKGRTPSPGSYRQSAADMARRAAGRGGGMNAVFLSNTPKVAANPTGSPLGPGAYDTGTLDLGRSVSPKPSAAFSARCGTG